MDRIYRYSNTWVIDVCFNVNFYLVGDVLDCCVIGIQDEVFTSNKIFLLNPFHHLHQFLMTHQLEKQDELHQLIRQDHLKQLQKK